MISSLKKMRGDKKGWYKVSDLVAGLEIACPRADFDRSVEPSARSGDIVWDEIMSITPVGREQVYDIEVEGTHNFVGNGIFAHNTYVLRANTALAVEGQIYAGGVIVPAGNAAGATSTPALESHIPSEVLTADGLGVDLYKLATYNLSVGQALAEKVGAHEMRLVSLEERLAALESGAISVAGGSSTTFSTTSLASALQSFGVDIMQGLAHFVKIATDNLHVGSPAHPTGITMYDKMTGQPYCFQIDNGAATTTPGACQEQVIENSEQVIVNTPDTSLPDGSASTTPDNLQPTTSGGDVTPPAVSDVEPPVVTLVGDAALQLTVGDAFTDPGATALDDTDGDLTTHISVSGAVDATAAGLYELTYSATDTAGNTGSVSRVVTVVASTNSPQVAAPAPAP